MATAQALHSVTLLAMLALGQQRGSPLRMFDDEKPSFPSITVTGFGKISARPDVADVTVGVLTQAATAKAALEANSTAMDRLHVIFSERGVANKDIRTLQVEILPVHSQPQPQTTASPIGAPYVASSGTGALSTPEFVPRIVAYKVANSVQITARQVDKLGPMLDAAVQGGANQLSGISFRVERTEQLLDEARKRAIADAKRKAELLASESGMVVGIPWKIEEFAERGNCGPSSFFEREVAILQAPSRPIAVGEQELSVIVSVVYELKNPR